VTELAGEGPGDVLVFCSGEREIRDAVDALEDLNLRHTEVLPLFGRLSAGEQHRVFSGHKGRRIIVSTNVAETSLTVPGIRYVVDTGMARISRYNQRTKVQQLPIEAISQASAEQRSGRCGRLGPGICIRLFDEDDLTGRSEFTDPEILRTSLASVILQMAAVGLGEIERFPFIDGPETRSIRDGISLLTELAAIGSGDVGTRDWLTPIGRKLARLPIDPRLGRMLLAADENACLEEVLTIVSALSIQDPRERPSEKEQAADERHRRFSDPTSDLLSWLHLWDHISSERRKRTSSQFRKMCRDDFLSWRRVREWQDLRAQLHRATRDLGMKPNRGPSTPSLIHESLLSGLLSHVGRKEPAGWEYRGARGARFAIRPGSVLFKKGPQWVMAAELIQTTRTWATGVAAVDPSTVERVGSHLVRRTVSEPWWDAEKGSAVARETVTLFGLTIATDQVVIYDRFNTVAARDLFIRHALVAGDWESEHAFARHNVEQIDAILEIETRERRGDLLVSEDVIADWFDARLPADITSAARFDAWWRTIREGEPNRFSLDAEDLTVPDAASPNEAAFPRSWHYGDLELPLTYEFDPSSPNDGVTIDIPVASLDRIDPSVFEWNVPGLREDLITALLRSLPKQLRRQFAPVRETALEVTPEIHEAEGRLIESLARALTRRSREIIRPDDFDIDRLPAHLIPRYRLTREDGSIIAEGADLEAMRSQLRHVARETLSSSAHPIERSGITAWDFGSIPRTITIGDKDQSVNAYPALVDDGDSVSIRLMATEDEQDDATWKGLRRLALLTLPSPTRLLRNVLAGHDPGSIVDWPYENTAQWMDDCMNCAVDAVLTTSGGLVWTEDDYRQLIKTLRAELGTSLETIGETAVGILSSLHRLDVAIAAVSETMFGDVLADIDKQIDRFIFPGFIAAVGSNRLADVKRYVDAAVYRLEKLREHPERDRERMAHVVALEKELDDLTDALSWSQQMVDTAWMLQELRVSLFAQPIGAKGSISEKRIQSALRDLLT
jgi:ATP-dependent helicase HrpA